MKKKKAKACNTDEAVAGRTEEEKKKQAKTGVQPLAESGFSRDGEEKKKETNRVETAIVDYEMVPAAGDAEKSDPISRKKKGKKKLKTAKRCDVESSEAGETMIEPEAVGASRDGDAKEETGSRNDPGSDIVDDSKSDDTELDPTTAYVTQEKEKKKKKIRKRMKKIRDGDGEATKVDTESASLIHTKDGTSRDGEEKVKESTPVDSDCAGLVAIDTGALAKKKMKKRKKNTAIEPGDINGEPGAKKKKGKVKKNANLEDNERTLIANADTNEENQNVSTLEPRETEEDVPLECPVDTEKKKRKRKKKKVKATGDNIYESKEELGESPQDAVMEENMVSIQSLEKPSEGKPVAENPSESADSIKESSPAIVERIGALSEANNSSLKRLNRDHDSEADGSVVEKEIVTHKRMKSRDSMEASKSSDEVGCVVAEKELEETLPVRSLVLRLKKKLLILDVNGILVDFVEGNNSQHKPDIRISGKDVFKRPYCDEFLEFCFERFTVAVWTSRLKRNMEKVIDFLFGESQRKLLFSWDRSQCTLTGFNTIENRWKPLVLKELKKVWDKVEPDLLYEKGDYDETNTLLVDDSPYKAIRNPVNTAIFPREYRFTDRGDKVLGPGGALRAYLEGLVSAKNVQKYVNRYPFGLPSITKSHRSWDFYERVIKSMECRSRS